MEIGLSSHRRFLEYLPLHEAVYRHLKEQILLGERGPGDRLIQRKIADGLGVSRAPVRDAIRRLRGEGLVRELPRVGHCVAEISEQEVRDLYLARELLEVSATKLAAQNASPEQVNAMTEVLRQLEEAVTQDDLVDSYRLGSRFHELVAESSGNAILQELLATLRDRGLRYRILAARIPGRPREGLADHYEILKRIMAKDAERAGVAMGKHIRDSSKRILDDLDEISRDLDYK